MTKNGEEIPLQWEIAVNDTPLERVRKRGSDYFRFFVGFFAGDIRLSVLEGERVHYDIQLVIEPNRYKLTSSQYAAMIADINRSTLALYHFGQVTLPAHTKASARRNRLVTLELVRTYFHQFEAAVNRISERPARVLSDSHKRVGIFEAKGLTSRQVAKAVRSASFRQATEKEARAAPKFVGATRGGWTPIVSQSEKIESTDLYEHRAILGFMNWLDTVFSYALRDVDGDAEFGIPAIARVRVERWRQRLARMKRKSVFREVSAVSTLKATTRFRMNPDYARAYAAMNAMRAGLGDGHWMAPAVPVDRTYALYEMWCYITLLEIAVALDFAAQPDIHTLLSGLSDPSRLGVKLASGASSRISLGPNHTLTYQRRFSATPDDEQAGTRLLEAVPDITISAIDASGRCRGLSIFDPKYRVGSSLLDGIRDLHVYRDAILGPTGESLVAFAVALSPDAGPHSANVAILPNDCPAALTVKPGGGREIFEALVKVGTSV